LLDYRGRRSDVENECFPDPESMDSDEKIELINSLHEANHQLIDQVREMADVVASGYNAMVILSSELMEGDAKGKRQKAMAIVATKLDIIGRNGLLFLGVTPEDIEESDKFMQIISPLEDDPNFNQEEGEE
jgi:hypothetical protein